MAESDRIKYLRVALLVVGLIFIFGIWSLTIVWPSGWAWHAGGRSEYLEMILGVYATLGVFLIIASRDPLAHKSLYLVHGLVQFRAWGDHGLSIRRGRPAHRTFMGRCLGSNCCGSRIGSLDASTDN